ncbi:methyltransferase domain-containing protein [Seonamhaeicola sp.]|uniref:methyltransferase domain-containing protein n=1 Tax=Seonamhaeicola sp. TaxID=1912245 RepID=UPI0026144D6D|nr:methyltransferase domain-containing protein [Seonamhaeicola sp.]
MKLEFLKKNLINPISKEDCAAIEPSEIVFNCGHKYETVNNIPVIIDESRSIFSVCDILEKVPTAQNSNYRKDNLKNIIRKKVLPSLSKDFGFRKRYEQLADKFKGKKVLVVGAGDKVAFYNKTFKDSLVITSDVHLQFNPDIVFDAHHIPFKNESFDLVLVPQVLEHTFRPWEVANELQRVTKLYGNLLIETPFNFPYHSPPYDFFRFTFTGLRSLFPYCALEKFEANEGSASAVATFNAQFLIDLFSNRYLRMLMLFVSRFMFGWIKYLDVFKKRTAYLSMFSPMGLSMIFKKDNLKRGDVELLNDSYKLKQ